MNNLINPIMFKDNIGEEIWTPITNTVVMNIHQYYHISTYGRIYSEVSNKMLSPHIDKYGYEVVCIYRTDGTHIPQFVHRLALLSFMYIPDNILYQVNHINGVKTNNYLYNLEWSTPKENVQHAFDNGLRWGLSGEDNPMSTITNEQADNIGCMILEGKKTYTDIAKSIGCSSGIVESISNGHTWKQVYNKYNLGDNKRVSGIFTNMELHHICGYFESAHDTCKTRRELYTGALNGLGIEYTESLRKTMERILNKKRFHEITKFYKY